VVIADQGSRPGVTGEIEQAGGAFALADLRVGQASGHRHPLSGGDQVQLQAPVPAGMRGAVAVAELTASGLVVLGDKGYLGEDCIRTPCRERSKPASWKEANRVLARRRASGERACARLKSWRILRELRCCPWRAGQLVEVIHVLQAREIEGWKRSGPAEATGSP
jgi:hypothetical protein